MILLIDYIREEIPTYADTTVYPDDRLLRLMNEGAAYIGLYTGETLVLELTTTYDDVGSLYAKSLRMYLQWDLCIRGFETNASGGISYRDGYNTVDKKGTSANQAQSCDVFKSSLDDFIKDNLIDSDSGLVSGCLIR